MDAIKTAEGGLRMRVTESVLWSGAVNLNPVYQRLQWAAACVRVAASLLPPFACFVLPDARSFVASHTTLTAWQQPQPCFAVSMVEETRTYI